MMHMQKVMSSRESDILSYYGFVCSIADRLRRGLPNTVDREELMAVGMIGLIEAYDRFDSTKGISFLSYADMRVRGSMIDMLRQQDWVPRSVRKRQREREDGLNWFQDKYNRTPNLTEQAAYLCCSEKQLEKQIARDQILALVSAEQSVYETEGITIKDTLAMLGESVEMSMVRQQREDALEKEILSLPEKERLAIELYYREGLSLKKIGKRLGVTESRACQIRSKAVQRLQWKLREYSDFC